MVTGESLFKRDKSIISPWIYSRTVMNTVFSFAEKKKSNNLWKSLQ